MKSKAPQAESTTGAPAQQPARQGLTAAADTRAAAFADHGPRTHALRRATTIIGQSPRVQRQAQQSALIDHSPHIIAERGRLSGMFGKAARFGDPSSTAEPTQDAFPPAQFPFVQRKRDITDRLTQEDFGRNKRKRGDSERESDTLKDVEANYNKSLQSGRKVIGEGIKWYAGDEGRQKKIETYGGTYQSVIAAGYKVFWFFADDESVTICMVRGKEHQDLSSGEVEGYAHNGFEDDQDYFYANTFNVIKGDFHASINYREADNRIAQQEQLPPALSNSEIIWFQHQLAKEAYREKHGGSDEPSKIASISREQIGNTQTLDTIFMSDDARVTMKKGAGTIDEPREEAIALLGTPNGNSAVWILIQHEESGTVDIERVDYTKDGLVIRYMR